MQGLKSVWIPALAGVTSVRLRVGPDFPAERQKAILDALAAAGISDIRVEALPFEIATSRVGYYRADDEAAAGCPSCGVLST